MYKTFSNYSYTNLGQTIDKLEYSIRGLPRIDDVYVEATNDEVRYKFNITKMFKNLIDPELSNLYIVKCRFYHKYILHILVLTKQRYPIVVVPENPKNLFKEIFNLGYKKRLDVSSGNNSIDDETILIIKNEDLLSYLILKYDVRIYDDYEYEQYSV